MTKEELLARTKRRTRRDELQYIGDNSAADFTYNLTRALQRFSQDSLALRGDASGTLAVDDNTIVIPSDMIDGIASIDALTLGDETQTKRNPLLVPLSWDEYNQGSIKGYALRGKTLYVRPVPETSQLYMLTYRKFHGTDLDTIEFEDKYTEAMVSLLCKMVYEDLELDQKAGTQEIKYMRELNMVIDEDQLPMVQFRRRS